VSVSRDVNRVSKIHAQSPCSTLQTGIRRRKSEEKKEQRDRSHTLSGIVAAAEIGEHGDQRHQQQDTHHPPAAAAAAAQLLHGRRRNSPRTDCGRPHAFSSSCRDRAEIESQRGKRRLGGGGGRGRETWPPLPRLAS
jgi:hypothetical protein